MATTTPLCLEITTIQELALQARTNAENLIRANRPIPQPPLTPDELWAQEAGALLTGWGYQYQDSILSMAAQSYANVTDEVRAQVLDLLGLPPSFLSLPLADQITAVAANAKIIFLTLTPEEREQIFDLLTPVEPTPSPSSSSSSS